MAEHLMTKVWALDFAAHRWDAEGTGANDPDSLTKFTSPNVKFIALAIARSSLVNGACWARQQTIAECTGVSKQTVARCIAELESAGWIRRIVRRRDDGGRSTDKIWLTLPEVVLPAEIVPPRPGRFLPGGEDDMVHHGDPPLTVDENISGSRGPPIKESSQKGISEGKEERILSDFHEGTISKVDLDTAVGAIWSKASKAGRARSSKADIAKSLRAALARGHQMETIMRGMGGFFASADAIRDDGASQAGAHRKLENDRFLSFIDEQPEPANAAERQARAQVGTDAAPSTAIQELWMKLFNEGMPWPSDRGPQPGRLGCRVDPAIQLKFGHVAFGLASPADDAAAFD